LTTKDYRAKAGFESVTEKRVPNMQFLGVPFAKTSHRLVHNIPAKFCRSNTCRLAQCPFLGIEQTNALVELWPQSRASPDAFDCPLGRVV
jgi:hypothetical protein